MITENHFEKIAIELRPMLLDLGYRFFADKSKAEDVVQEVLMRLWVMRNRLGPDDNIKALSVRMAKNVCVSQWRHFGRRVNGGWQNDCFRIEGLKD